MLFPQLFSILPMLNWKILHPNGILRKSNPKEFKKHNSSESSNFVKFLILTNFHVSQFPKLQGIKETYHLVGVRGLLLYFSISFTSLKNFFKE